MRRRCVIYTVLVFSFIFFGWSLTWAQNVRVTPLGSHTGEFCRNDRALIFEDSAPGSHPLRILYDPGRTVTGGTDARLGSYIDVMLLSHVHVDHLGDVATSAVNAGTCASPDTSVPKTPDSNFVEIAKATGATIPVGGEMPGFLNAKIGASKAVTLRPGGKRTIGGVTFATVRALHSNGVSNDFLTSPLPDGRTAYVGPEEGYIIKFSNGLVVYLSGDTGVTSDMLNVVRLQYGAKVAVINIGDTFSTGPQEAAFAINELIKPVSVIPSHANEEATSGGVVIPGTKTDTFMSLVDPAIGVHVPKSGMTMMFKSDGTCVGGGC